MMKIKFSKTRLANLLKATLVSDNCELGKLKKDLKKLGQNRKIFKI